MTSKPPIAIFAYNRPDRLETLLSSLENCIDFEQYPVTVFIDGPRNVDDVSKIAMTREVVTKFGFPNVKIVARQDNQGLRRSIFAGVSQLCQAYGRVIVLEDDLYLSPLSLQWFEKALNKYANEERIWSVSGYMFRVPELGAAQEALFLPWAHPWGWATWDRAWSKFQLDADIDERILKSAYFRKVFNLNGLRNFSDMLCLQKESLINSWYIQWYLTIALNGGLSVFPPRPLVANRGMSQGTHASKFNPYRYFSTSDKLAYDIPPFKEGILPDWWAIDLISKCWDARLQREIGRLGSWKRKVRRFFRGAK